MLQRISIGLQAVLAIALVVIAGMLYHTLYQVQGKWAALQQQANANQQMLAHLVRAIARCRSAKETRTGRNGRHDGRRRRRRRCNGVRNGRHGDDGSPRHAGNGYGSGSAAGGSPLPEGAATLSLTLTMETEDGPPAEGLRGRSFGRRRELRTIGDRYAGDASEWPGRAIIPGNNPFTSWDGVWSRIRPRY